MAWAAAGQSPASAEWRALPLVRDGKLDGGWKHVGWGGFVVDRGAARQGMHVSEDHFLVECLHPETLEPVPDGEVGELVFTTLTKEAMPVLRYRTRDLAALDRRPCPCGRTGVRMSRVGLNGEVCST